MLVRIHATTVNRSDCGWRSATPFFTRLFTGIRRPKHRTPGTEFAGVVEQVGSAVTEFTVGGDVFGVSGSGANAEFICRREGSTLAHKPTAHRSEVHRVCTGRAWAASLAHMTRMVERERLYQAGQ